MLASDGSAITRTLAHVSIYPSALVPRRSSLESVFLEMTTEGPE